MKDSNLRSLRPKRSGIAANRMREKLAPQLGIEPSSFLINSQAHTPCLLLRNIISESYFLHGILRPSVMLRLLTYLQDAIATILHLVAEEVFETSNPAYEAFIYPDSPRYITGCVFAFFQIKSFLICWKHPKSGAGRESRTPHYQFGRLLGAPCHNLPAYLNLGPATHPTKLCRTPCVTGLTSCNV